MPLRDQGHVSVQRNDTEWWGGNAPTKQTDPVSERIQVLPRMSTGQSLLSCDMRPLAALFPCEWVLRLASVVPGAQMPGPGSEEHTGGVGESLALINKTIFTSENQDGTLAHELKQGCQVEGQGTRCGPQEHRIWPNCCQLPSCALTAQRGAHMMILAI